MLAEMLMKLCGDGYVVSISASVPYCALLVKLQHGSGQWLECSVGGRELAMRRPDAALYDALERLALAFRNSGIVNTTQDKP